MELDGVDHASGFAIAANLKSSATTRLDTVSMMAWWLEMVAISSITTRT